MSEDIPQDLAASMEGRLLATICSALDEREYTYQVLDARTVHLVVRNDHGAYRLLFTANDSVDFVRLLAGYGSNVPDDRRVAIAEAASRANTSIAIGNFELDFSDGELRFRIGMDVEEGVLSTKMVDNMVGFALHAMERYHDPFMRVAFGYVDPDTAMGDVP